MTPLADKPARAEADLTLDRLLRANIPGGLRHYLGELRADDSSTLSTWQRHTIQHLAQDFLRADGAPRDDKARNASWMALLDALIATTHAAAAHHDLTTMRDLLAQRPAQPIPANWPKEIARHAWRAGVARGQA